MTTKKLFFKPPRISTSSPVPAIFMTRKHVKLYNEMIADRIDRLDWGRVLFLLAVAEIVRHEIQQNAPDISMGEEEVPYAEDLRIGMISVEKDEASLAIYFESRKFKVSDKDVDSTVLIFQPKQGSPDWVNVLEAFGPWPSRMLPFPVTQKKAKIIARRAREDEIGAFRKRILGRRKIIQLAFKSAKAPSSEIPDGDPDGPTGNAVGIVANEDIGYNVLRTEFGYDGKQQVAHWRPALRELSDQIPNLMKKYLTYIENGRDDIFNIPSDVLEITSANYNKGDFFARALAPYAPKG